MYRSVTSHYRSWHKAEDAFSLGARGVRSPLLFPLRAKGSRVYADAKRVVILRRMQDEAWKKLFSGLDDDELQTAREHLDAYLELAWEIFEDIKVGTGPVDREPGEL